MTYMDEIQPHREAIDRLNNEIIDRLAKDNEKPLP